jgi:hypothetical protein
MKLNIGQVEFIGIVDMPQFEPLKKTNLFAKTEHGMGYIEHPKGYQSKEFETTVLMVNIKQHTKQL